MADAVMTTMLIQSAPAAIASLAGIAIALYLWAKHPRLSAIITAILLARLVLMAGSIAFTDWIYTSVDAGADPFEMGVYSGFVNWFLALATGALWFALALSVFIWRDTDTGSA